MKRMIATTALVAFAGLPVIAQQAGERMTSSQQLGEMEVQASNLIGARLYILRDRSQPTGEEAQDGAQLGRTQEVLPEGEAAETSPQPQQDQADLADLEEGVPQVPEGWTMAGEIDDVLLSQEGRVQALVVDAGGFLGMNESTRRVDIQEVRIVPDSDDQGRFFALYAGDRNSFEQSEPFDEASLQDGTARGTEMWRDEFSGEQADVAFTSITTDELIGTAVYGTEDEWIGEIEDIAMTDGGSIEAVIVDVGGFFGLGAKPVAVKMDMVQLRRGEGDTFGAGLRAYVSATEEEIESLPEWQREDR